MVSPMASKDESPTMVLLVREDLAMSPGKVAVQCGHGAVEVALSARKRSARMFEAWREGGSRKIALRVPDEAALNELRDRLSYGILHHTVIDAGRTEVAAGTVTVMALLGPRHAVDAVVHDLETY